MIIIMIHISCWDLQKKKYWRQKYSAINLLLRRSHKFTDALRKCLCNKIDIKIGQYHFY